MNIWSLPDRAEVGGGEYLINADFRDVLEVISWLNNPEEDDLTRRYVALTLFYEGFEEMPEGLYTDAFRWMMEFIAAGVDDDTPHPKLIDWDQDCGVIAAEINKVASTEIRSLKFLHWWTFVGYFSCIGEGQLSMIVSIREKLQKGKKLEKYERDFYTKNRSRVDFKQKFTQADEEILSKWVK